MLIHVPRSQLSRQAMLDAFHLQLDTAGCVTLPASFQVTTRGRLAEGATEPAPSPGAAEASHTGPNKVNEADRSVSGVANVFSVSRSGIKLHIDGLGLEHFNQCNPVVLACHSAVGFDLMPGAIGTVEKAYKAEKQTVLRFRNMTFDTDPIAEAWYQKVLKGIVRMVSVGFLPLEWSLECETTGKGKDKRDEYYFDIPKSELLEISVVPIGANRGAMIGQASAHQLIERITAAEQRAAALQDVVMKFLESEQSAAASAARSQLLHALKQFS